MTLEATEFNGTGTLVRPQGVDGMVWPGHWHPEAGLSVVLKKIPGETRRGLLAHDYHFQIPPLDEFGWDSSAGWSDYDVLRRGQFSRKGGRRQKALSLRTLVLDYNPSWASWAGGEHRLGNHIPGTAPTEVLDNNGNPTGIFVPGGGAVPRTEPGGRAPDPQQVAFDLDAICNQDTPIRLVCWNRALYDRPDVDMPVSLRSLSVRERAGEPDSRYFDLSFVEFRQGQMERRGYGKNRRHDLPARVKINGKGVAHEVAHGESELRREQRHKIGSEEKPVTLRKLAKHFYGEAGHWRWIAARNGMARRVGPDENLGNWVVRHKRGRGLLFLNIPKHGPRRGGDDPGRGGAGGRGSGSRG